MKVVKFIGIIASGIFIPYFVARLLVIVIPSFSGLFTMYDSIAISLFARWFMGTLILLSIGGIVYLLTLLWEDL